MHCHYEPSIFISNIFAYKITLLNFQTLFAFCWPRLFLVCGVFDAGRAVERTQYWPSICQPKISLRQRSQTWIAKYSTSCFISAIFFCVFAGRCGRELELCGCLWSMLIFSVNKLVVQVCLDFGRSVIFVSPNVNIFSKVQENCITVFTTLNSADGSKGTNTRRHQTNAASNQKISFIPAL